MKKTEKNNFFVTEQDKISFASYMLEKDMFMESIIQKSNSS